MASQKSPAGKKHRLSDWEACCDLETRKPYPIYLASVTQEPDDPRLQEALEAAAVAIPPPPAFRDQIEDQDPDDDGGYERLLAQLGDDPKDDEE